MERFTKDYQVFFWEEHIPTEHHLPYLEYHAFENTEVVAIRPRIPISWQGKDVETGLSRLLDQFIQQHRILSPVLWFYTPMMFPFAKHVEAAAVVYDCMDELTSFHFAPPELVIYERQLIQHADVVFTGGYSIFEAKRDQHRNIHLFPSSVDVNHFISARGTVFTPPEQANLPKPIFGYCGVIDERVDLDLIAAVAAARPHWSIVMLGPVVKIDPSTLPRAENIHYLGQKPYSELPSYLSGWDVALMPFANNPATKFISPTKTPEYLSAGKPVVSTPVADVVRTYNHLESVLIADTVEKFVKACERALELSVDPTSWLADTDSFLALTSWDKTYLSMSSLIKAAIKTKQEKISGPAVFRPNGEYPYDYLIAGAGFAGSVLAERLAASGKRVFLCDRRPHIAGNTFDTRNEAGILIHKYGPHIFHTNSEQIFSYLSRFTRWRAYEHRVLAYVDGKLLPIPINRTTLNELYGLNMVDEASAANFLAERAEPMKEILTARDMVISQVGEDLYRTFFEGYTRKQWGLDPSQLDKSVTARIPTRTSTDDRYFLDSYQAMPAEGFTHLFENMLDHDNIRVETGVDHRELIPEKLAPRTIFTGPIDSYFDYRFGPLPYRSLEFRHETIDREHFQPVAVVNYPSETVPYTRITEYKYLTGQIHRKTSISYEYAKDDGEPYYPIPRPENQALYKRYEALARTQRDVIFVGRLGTYKYYNMDQVVGQALAVFRRLEEKEVEVDHNWNGAAE